MKKLIRNALSYVLSRVYSLLMRNPAFKARVYADRNRDLFSNVDQHERMLADLVRVDSYHAAIHKHVKKGDTVVDVGAGTGILSFFASQKEPKRVYALDHGPIIEMAKHLAQENGITNIEFVDQHSSMFTLAEKVDVIIHEQIGDYLVDEDMVRNLCDLRDRILRPGGVILPSRFELFMEPVQMLSGIRTPFIWERPLHGIDLASSKAWLHSERNTIGKPDTRCRLWPNQVSHFLCEPAPIFAFDIMSADPSNMPMKFVARREVVTAGVMDGFCLFFNVRFDDDIEFCTGPFSKPTHWGNQLFRTEPFECRAGDVINLELELTRYTSVSTWKVDHSVERQAGEASPFSALSSA